MAVGQKSSEFARSPAISLLKAVGTPDTVVETDYRGAVAYFTGHRTAWTAFTTTTPYGPFGPENNGNCRLPVVETALRDDDAKFLMVGDVNGPGLMDSPCLLGLASSPLDGQGPGGGAPAVYQPRPDLGVRAAGPREPPAAAQRLDRGGRTVFLPERPRRRPCQGCPAGAQRSRRRWRDGYVGRGQSGRVDFTWYWPRPVPLSQLSVGSVTSTTAISSVTVSIETHGPRLDGRSRCPRAVGDTGAVPYLLAELPPGTTALGLRVSAETSGGAEVTYVNAIGAVP